MKGNPASRPPCATPSRRCTTGWGCSSPPSAICGRRSTAVARQPKSGAARGHRYQARERSYKHQKFAEAKPVAEEAVRLRQEALGPKHADTATSLDDLGAVLMANGDAVGRKHGCAKRWRSGGKCSLRMTLSYRRASTTSGSPSWRRETRSRPRRCFWSRSRSTDDGWGNDHPEVAIKLVNLARLNNDLHRPEAAEPFAREAVAIRRKVLGNDHPSLANALDQLANAVEMRHPDEEERLRREALAILTHAFGPGNRETARLQNNLGFMLYRRGAYQEAVSLYRPAVDTFRQTVGTDYRADPGRSTRSRTEPEWPWRFPRRGGGCARGLCRASAAADRPAGARRSSWPWVIRSSASGVSRMPFRTCVRPTRSSTSAAPHEFSGTSLKRRAVWGPRWPLRGIGRRRNGFSLQGVKACTIYRRTPAVRLRESIIRLIAFYVASGRRDDAAEWRKRLQGMALTGHVRKQPLCDEDQRSRCVNVRATPPRTTVGPTAND